MLNFLIDSCVWLDIPKDPGQLATLTCVEELVKDGELSLIVPQTLLDEIARNKNRIVRSCGQGLSDTLKKAKDAVARLSNPKQRKKAIDHFENLDLKLPFLEHAATETFGRIEGLLGEFPAIPASDAIMVAAARRAVDRRAPCHRGQNSINDAIIVETYAAAMDGKKGERFVFVTHNKLDFSQKDGDHRIPHPDIAPLFTRIKSKYSISLVDTLRAVMHPDAMAELTDEYNWTDEIRSVPEISEALDELFDKIWYNRHKCFEARILAGKVKIVPDKDYDVKRHNEIVVASVWTKALAAAKRVEKKYGAENLRWDDFEWGMLNGKMSALRWVYGDEWDMLDT